jgi:hypothetical protein
MTYLIRTVLIAGVVGMAGCAHTTAQHLTEAGVPCGERATQIIAQNVTSITEHRYRDASVAAEHAARVSLACAASEASTPQAFGDKWRGANELVVSAELAHQAADEGRAHRLLHEGYTIMHSLRPPRNASALTSSLIADKLDAARRDLQGQWALW